MNRYIWNILIAIDQFVNTIFGGDPDETISSRAGKQRKTKLWARILCCILDKIDTNHCADSIEPDEGKDSVID
jgi:hypothetical protein